MAFAEEDYFELRLFLEELVCDLCRFTHVAELGIKPQEVRIRQEVSVGSPDAFADIFIEVPGHLSYFVEVDYGYSAERIQPVWGSHIGMAMGDFQVLSLRPFSLTHIGVIGNAINMAARLSSHAGSGQIAVSNIVYRQLSSASQGLLREIEPIEAKNVGMIKAWTYDEERGA